MGCTAPKQAARAPTSLTEVNRALADTRATIVWRSGESLEKATYVRVNPDSVHYRRYTHPGGGKSSRWARGPLTQIQETTQSRAIEEVRWIQTEGRNGTGEGAIIGAFPGVVLSGVGTISSLDCSGRLSCSLGAAAVIYGVVIGAVGAAIGAIIGGIVTQEGQVVYVGPVERYRGNGLSTRSPSLRGSSVGVGLPHP
jgi:hypothetical protein